MNTETKWIIFFNIFTLNQKLKKITEKNWKQNPDTGFRILPILTLTIFFTEIPEILIFKKLNYDHFDEILLQNTLKINILIFDNFSLKLSSIKN